jgi:uncharacterized Zn finger protein
MSPAGFDIEAVREFVGERSFVAGEQIAADRRVDVIAAEDDSVSAHVTGESVYLVELRGWGGEGGCTCPAFDKFGPCKHMAAVALTFNDMDPLDLAEVRGRLSRLRDGLALDSKEGLIARIIDLAKQHPIVLRALDPRD